MNKTNFKIKIFFIFLFWVISVGLTRTTLVLPETGLPLSIGEEIPSLKKYYGTKLFNSEQNTPPESDQNFQDISFQSFVNRVIDGEKKSVRGIYSEGVLAFPVVKQPDNQPGFVSSIDGVVTEFSLASSNGVTGLLAHNYLSGRYFYNIDIGDEIQIIYGDGAIKSYKVIAFEQYQALQPDSPHSRFVDLESGEQLSATDLFKRVYLGDHHLTLQTCIQEGGVDSWGRLFIIADPIL